MKKIILLILLFLPIASFAEETTDDMTTIFEEHFDGWFNLHASGMNATYAVSSETDVTLQNLKVSKVTSGYPCLRFAKFSSINVVIPNNTGAYGTFVLSFKQYNGDFDVTYNDKANSVKNNSDGTFTFKVAQNTKQITLKFHNPNNSTCYLDDIVVKAYIKY